MAASAGDWVRPHLPIRRHEETTGIFSLPREIRDQIYREFVVYPDIVSLDLTFLQALFDGTYISDETLMGWSPYQWRAAPAIVQVNKQFYREATAILYSANRFSYQDVRFLPCFLDKIGQLNANLLRHLIIPLPKFHNNGHLSGITLMDDSVQAFDMIQERCQGLATLEMSQDSTPPDTTQGTEIRLDEFDSPQTVDQALAMIDARVKRLHLIRGLHFHLRNGSFSVAVREKMTSYGWTSETTTASEWVSNNRYALMISLSYSYSFLETESHSFFLLEVGDE